jgi:hypothetical protein
MDRDLFSSENVKNKTIALKTCKQNKPQNKIKLLKMESKLDGNFNFHTNDAI